MLCPLVSNLSENYLYLSEIDQPSMQSQEIILKKIGYDDLELGFF